MPEADPLGLDARAGEASNEWLGTVQRVRVLKTALVSPRTLSALFVLSDYACLFLIKEVHDLYPRGVPARLDIEVFCLEMHQHNTSHTTPLPYPLPSSPLLFFTKSLNSSARFHLCRPNQPREL